jgi:hypothetical protein
VTARLPDPGEVWTARLRLALRAEPPGRSGFMGGPERESVRLLREITDLADDLDRRGQLMCVLVMIRGVLPFYSGSLDHPDILPLIDELGDCLGIGPCPRPAAARA